MRWFNSLILYLFAKQSSKVQKLILKKTQNNIKKIELVNGEVRSMSGYGKESIDNKIQSYTIWQYFLEILRFWLKFETLMILVFMVIALSLYEDAINELVLLFQYIVLFLDFSLYATKCLLKCRNYHVIESQLNQQTYYILDNFIHQPQTPDSQEDVNSYFHPQKQVLREQIKVGDILILQKSFECPADVLILEASQLNVYIDENEFGITRPKSCLPCQSTFGIYSFYEVQPKQDTKGLLIEFKLTLNGLIQYSYTKGKRTSLMGTVKLKNDPKVFKFHSENIIFAGEKIMNTDWVLGIVLVAGNNCLRVYKPIKNKNRKSLLVISLLVMAYLISLLANLIYKNPYAQNMSFNSMLIPLYAIFYKEFVQIYNYIKQPSIRKTVKPRVEYGTNQGKQIIRDDKHILIDFNKVKNMTEINSQSKLSKYEDIQDFQIMMRESNYWNCCQVNLICLELNQQYFLKAAKIKSIYIDDKQYNFKYKQLVTLMNSNQIQFGDNYFKTLLDTGRDNELLDEEKKDYSELINSHFPSPHNQDAQNYGGSTNLQFSVSKKIEVSQPRKLKYSMGKTISFRTKIIKSGSDQSSSINQLQKQQFNEQQFVTQLFDDFDNQYHERVIAMLLLCEIENKYNEQKNTIETYSKNMDDYVLIEFCNRLDYKLKCSIEAERQVYDLSSKISLKVIEIQGKLKQYKILSENKPTKQRQGIYSVLLKDPEEFNEDEGALVYIKMETSRIFENTNMNINVLETNSTLYYMLRQGEKPTIYFKKQLKKAEAKQFLETKLNILNSYTSDEEQLEQLYNQLESQAELLMIVGSHSKIEQSALLTIDAFTQANLNTWLISAEDYFTTLRFLFDAKFIESDNDLSVFDSGDERTLQFAIQSACSNLIKQQRILEAQELDKKYIILSCEALLSIIKDEFLLNHFAIIVGFSKGLVMYNSQEISKSKLFKIAKKLNMHIAYIGSCGNNQRVYSISKISIDINPRCYTQTKPCYLVNSLRCAESILITQCISSALLAQSILYFWLYQLVMFVIINLINQGQFLQQSCCLLLLLSQTFTVIIQLLSHNKRFKSKEIYLKGLIRQRCLVKPLFNRDSLIKIFLTSVIDAAIVSVPLLSTKYLYGDSNYLPLSQFAFITTLEFIIRIQLWFQLWDQQQKQMLGIVFLSLLIVGFVTFLTVPDYIDYKVTYQDLFYSPGNLIRSLIFIYIFAFIFKFSVTCILQFYNIEMFADVVLTDENNFKLIESTKRQRSNRQMLHHSIQKRKKFIKSILADNNQMDDSIYKALNNNINNDEQIELKKNLTFNQKEFEMRYEETMGGVSVVYILLELTIFINLLIQISNISNNIVLYIIWATQLCYSLTIQILHYLEILQTSIQLPLQQIGIISRFTFQYISIFLLQQDCIINQTLFSSIMMIIVLSYSIQLTLKFKGTVILMSLIGLGETLRFTIPEYSYYTQKQVVFVIAIIIVCCLAFIAGYFLCYVNEFLRRQSFLLQEQFEKEQKKLNDALGILMPRFIKERMARGYIQIQEDQGPVTILFCDICEFDDIIESEQVSIIGLMDSIYRSFDSICNQCNVQKIETVGSTYVCASGLKDYDIIDRTSKNSTQRIIECAMMMMEATCNLKYQDKQIIIKIGINYGNVMAGVIGQHKPQFSLIGDTVNTTSRVCSISEPGRITLTESAYARVKQLKYQFQVKEVNMKNIYVIYQLILNKKSTFQNKADRSPVIKLVTSIQFKKLDSSEKPINDLLSNAVNPAGFQFDATRKYSVSKKQQSVYQLPIEQFGKVIQEVMTGQKILQEVSYRRQTLHRKSRYTKFKEVNPKMMSSPDQGQERLLPPQQKQQEAVADQFADLFDNMKVADSQKVIDDNVPKSPLQKQSPQNPGNNNLFDSTIQQEEKIEIPKLQQLIGNQEKIESDMMQELIRVKCDFGSSQNNRRSILYSQIYFRQFKYKEMIKIYNIKLFKDMVHYCLIEFCFLMIFQLPVLFALMEYQAFLGVNLTMEGLKIAFYIMSCIIVPFCLKDAYEYIFQVGMIVGYFVLILFTIITTIVNNPIEEAYITLIVSFTLCIGYYLRSLPLFTSKQRKILFSLMYIDTIIKLAYTGEWNETIVFIIPIEIFIQMQRNQNEEMLYQNYNIHEQLSTHQQQQNKIISHLLPSHILQYYFKEQDTLPDVFENATILYADIAGFTKYSSSVDAQQVLQMLSSLFNKFDVACTENSVYKLYSIGDSYVVLGVLDAISGIREEEAFNVVNLAMQMLEIVNLLKKNIQYPDINLRIGIHTGNIIGGIVGTDIVKYDIYGSDVAIAKKMEQNSQLSRIMVSEDTMKFLETAYTGEFSYTFANQVTHRNRIIQGYYIERVQIEE